jgi:hypothetical protein
MSHRETILVWTRLPNVATLRRIYCGWNADSPNLVPASALGAPMSKIEWEVMKKEDYYRATGPPEMEVGMVDETVLRWIQDRDLRDWDDDDLEHLAGILQRWGRLSPRETAGLLGVERTFALQAPDPGPRRRWRLDGWRIERRRK